jgi:hypothetical protein
MYYKYPMCFINIFIMDFNIFFNDKFKYESFITVIIIKNIKKILIQIFLFGTF